MTAVRRVALVVACLCWGVALHLPMPVGADEEAIVPQPLAETLSTLAARRGLRIVYVADAADGQMSRGAPAGLSTAETLEALLAGTGLAYEFINERTVRIFRPGGTVNEPAAPRAGTAMTAASAYEYTLSADPATEGYALEDGGAMVMSGAPAWRRRERFEIWQGPAGERLLRSVTVAADGRYRVEAEWRSDAKGRHHRARGIGAIGDEPLRVDFVAEPGAARVTIRRGAREPEVIEGPCSPDCMIDMMPNGLAMFMMTRDPRLKPGVVLEFHWFGHSLNEDALMTDAVTRITRVAERRVKRPDGSVLVVRHDAFTESLTEYRSGVRFDTFTNLWTDDQGRPLRWSMATTGGIREGFEDLASLEAATREQVFSATSEAAASP